VKRWDIYKNITTCTQERRGVGERKKQNKIKHISQKENHQNNNGKKHTDRKKGKTKRRKEKKIEKPIFTSFTLPFVVVVNGVNDSAVVVNC